jgi:hypothetical protein
MLNYEEVLNNDRVKPSVRYAMLRSEIVEKGKNREDKRKLLLLVGHSLGGELQEGKPNFWQFPDGSKAKFK